LQPEHLKFGGGAASSAFNPLVLLLVLIVGVVMLVRENRGVIAPFLWASIMIPLDQVVVIGPLHFPMLRVLLLFGMVRIAREKFGSKTPVFSGGINRLDKVVIWFELFTVANALMLWRDGGMVVRQAGDMFTLFGIYFLMRHLLRDNDDSDVAIRTLAYIAMAVAAIMTFEQTTGRNPYALLGGANAAFYGNLITREDRLRSVAGFGHPLLAGTFGAIVLPLFIGLWLKDRKNFKLMVAGLGACTVIVITSASSTPMLAYAGGLMALFLWPMRKLMRPIRWGIVMLLVSLHLVMKAPVWQLIDRMSIVGGSSGYHRYQLVDQCIRHFGDWWLYGVKDTGAWGWDMWDTANQYVSVADSTGLVPLILFVATLVYGFKYVVRARDAWTDNKNMQLYNWALGGALFANCVGFFGISYWDQTQVVWYTFLAIIVASYYSVPVAAEAQITVPVPETPAIRVTKPLRPAYASENAKPVTSYGRMVSGRLTPKSTTK
jgi:hypothetical protein